MKQCSMIYEYLRANRYLDKVIERNTNTWCGICSKPTIKASKRHVRLNVFLYSNVSTKKVKKQSVLTVPKVLKKLNKLKIAFKRSRYRHNFSYH